jgi:hypothetical protein
MFFEMGLLDALFVIAAILIVLWLLGFVFFNLGAIIWILLVVAIIIILFRLLSGCRVYQTPNSIQKSKNDCVRR